jgi:hypothetical protein
MPAVLFGRRILIGGMSAFGLALGTFTADTATRVALCHTPGNASSNILKDAVHTESFWTLALAAAQRKTKYFCRDTGVDWEEASQIVLRGVVVIERPTKKEAEDGAVERLVFGPKAVLAKNQQSAAIAAVLSEDAPKIDMQRAEVLVRPRGSSP